MAAQEAITHYVEATNGVKYAHRKIGSGSSIPLVCHMHYRGNMDWWDPELINVLALRRQVIIFDGPGVGKTAGEVPATFEGWADDMILFISALGFQKADGFGYSMGSRAVQMAALKKPEMFRKLDAALYVDNRKVLAGSSPIYPSPDSPPEDRDRKYMMGMATAKTYEESKDAFRLALFGESDTGRKHFDQWWKRVEGRTAEPPLLQPLELDPGGNNQALAVLNADKPENVKWPDRLTELKMPVLVANGKKDLTLGTNRSVDLFSRLTNAQLLLYPQSGHGFLFQYPHHFGEQVNAFLDTDVFDCNI